jgi:hypothetical protein
MCRYCVSTYTSWIVEGFRRWRGYILASQSNPDLQGSCSLASHCSLSDRSEQNSSNFDTLFTSLKSFQLFKGYTARCLETSFSVKGLILVRNGLNMTYSCTLIQVTLCTLLATEQQAMPSEQWRCLMWNIMLAVDSCCDRACALYNICHSLNSHCCSHNTASWIHLNPSTFQYWKMAFLFVHSVCSWKKMCEQLFLVLLVWS